MTDVLARARAAFLGVAVGDALGATTEFLTPEEIRHRYGVHDRIVGGGWLHLRPGKVTDDTEMSLCIARAVTDAGGWTVHGIAQEFVRWMKGKPVDLGATCRRGIRDYLLKGQLETPPNEWDAGNGAAMRVAPVALCTLGDEEEMARCAVAQAHITHNHPLSDAACIGLGRMVHRAVLGATRERLHETAHDLCAREPRFRFEPYRGEASGYVADTMRTVFHHFFATASFRDCLVATVNQGGDADTAGAIAGMLAGAHYGSDAIPPRWLRKLDPGVRQEVETLAERLVALSPVAGRGGREGRGMG
jgi:ADP-ribosyl-[dinitrogen reductase] hydrolase